MWFGLCFVSVLAVAYSTGKVVLSDIENSSSIHTFQTKSKPTTLLWSSQPKSDSHHAECFQDLSSEFLPNLPAFEKGYFAHDFKFVNFVLCFWSFNAFTLLVGWQEGHPACKKTEWWGTGMVICLEWGATATPLSRVPVKSRMVYRSGAGLPRLSWKKGC